MKSKGKSKKNGNKSIGLDLSALRIIKVGMLIVAGEEGFADTLEFDPPVTYQTMADEMSLVVGDTEVMLGFVIFTPEGHIWGFMNPGVSDEDAKKKIATELEAEFVPEGRQGFNVLYDHAKDPYLEVPVDFFIN